MKFFVTFHIINLKIHFCIIIRKYNFVFTNTIFVEKYKFCINITAILLLGYPNTLWPGNLLIQF